MTVALAAALVKAEAEVKPPRLHVLDSLRGLAAVTVMVHHYLLTFPAFFPYGQPGSSAMALLMQFSPLHLIWAGYEAVLLFFVLSGFVLALPYWSGQPFDYSPFIIRRWARVWIPYITAVTLAMVFALLLGGIQVAGLSIWYSWPWNTPSVADYLNHVLLIGNLDPVSAHLLPVVWSLRYEMLASLAFPVLLFLANTWRWPQVLALGAALNVVGYLYADSFRPFQYVLMFLVGILLARHKDRLVLGLRALPRLAAVPLLAGALALYLCTWFGWSANHSFLQSAALDWGITAAAAFAIIAALGSRTAHQLLNLRPVLWLGRVSYSIYLMHTLVLLSVVHLLGNLVPVWLLVICCIPLTLLASEGFYRWVELPAIRLGRRLSGKRYL